MAIVLFVHHLSSIFGQITFTEIDFFPIVEKKIFVRRGAVSLVETAKFNYKHGGSGWWCCIHVIFIPTLVD